jgi:hypothetical protein
MFLYNIYIINVFVHPKMSLSNREYIIWKEGRRGEREREREREREGWVGRSAGRHGNVWLGLGERQR